MDRLKFNVEDAKYALLPLNKKRLLMASEAYSRLSIDVERFRACYALELLRVVGQHRVEACTLIAICTSEAESSITTLAAKFHKMLDDTDIASLIAVLLVYYTNEIQSFAKKEVRNERNTL